MQKILIVDGDISMCMLLEQYFSKNNFSVKYVHTAPNALKKIDEFHPAIILIDYGLIDIHGKNLLKQFSELNHLIKVIVISSHMDVKHVVCAIKQGAYDYIIKPLFPEEILLTVNNALFDQVNNGSVSLNANNQLQGAPNYFFSESKEYGVVQSQIQLVAPTNYSVIIYGESGSGKERAAVEIHLKSDRSNEPFIPIDCGTLSKELAASELFGHEKGSFTGAIEQKIGILELANSGTIFLDEVSNLTYEVQVSLLRVVQERKIRRIGGKKDIEIDIRIIVASNEHLWEMTQQGKFREDLFHRFNEFSIKLPPLRNRKLDIEAFSSFFLSQSNQELGKNVVGFRPEVMQLFLDYAWPGNLRELKNTIKRAALLESTSLIQISTLPIEMLQQIQCQLIALKEDKNYTPHPLSFILSDIQIKSNPEENVNEISSENNKALKKVSIGAEYKMILETIKKVKNNKSKAANLLQIDRKTLYNKLKRYKAFTGL